jgi:Na+-translocating ferredoxin:NAD+ oxidoreductase RnfD subunit
MLAKLFARIDLYLLMIIVLLVVTAIAIPTFGFIQTIPQLAVAVFTAAALDAFIWRLKYKKFHFSKTAFISGLFIGGLLEPSQMLYVPAVAAVVAILSKHFINIRKQHIFNPALLSLAIAASLFQTSISWWAALSLPIILAAGIVLHLKFWRWDLIFTFLATYFAIFSVQSRFDFAALQLQLLNPMLYYFTFFMLVEPRTSPARSRGRLIYGPLAAVIIFLANLIYPSLGFVLGLLLANLAVIFIKWKIEKIL